MDRLRHTDGWIDGQTDAQMDEWIDRWHADTQTNGWMDRLTDIHTDGLMSGLTEIHVVMWTDEWTGRLTHRQVDIQMDDTDGQTDRW